MNKLNITTEELLAEVASRLTTQEKVKAIYSKGLMVGRNEVKDSFEEGFNTGVRCGLDILISMLFKQLVGNVESSLLVDITKRAKELLNESQDIEKKKEDPRY